jgi:peptidoglycan/xylan/chitin deacetylase (PgdA/CDA1 family)
VRTVPRPSIVIRALYGAGAAALILPALPLVRSGVAPPPAAGAVLGTAIPAFGAGLAAMIVVRYRKRRAATWLGGAIVAAGAWLLSQARPGSIDWVLAGLIGIGVALGWPHRLRLRDSALLAGGGVVAIAAVLLAAGDGAATAQAWGGLCGLALGVAALVYRRGELRAGVRPRRAVLAASTVAVVLLLGAWIGANSPTASWFGSTISHGRRDQPLVALTFDDGPNATSTLAIAAILDAHDAKGTFFTIGKALDQRPDISRALLADGQLLGDHSYHHDEWRWLDPTYPELARTQAAFRRQLGTCPALYRPPHGQHTPLLSWVVHRHGMRMVTWDVSATDWATGDAALIARRVLARVRPGSIIDLHDGLDGKVAADRTVVVRALPLILGGLDARRLRPVRLDQLLGVRGYLDHC